MKFYIFCEQTKQDTLWQELHLDPNGCLWLRNTQTAEVFWDKDVWKVLITGFFYGSSPFKYGLTVVAS